MNTLIDEMYIRNKEKFLKKKEIKKTLENFMYKCFNTLYYDDIQIKKIPTELAIYTINNNVKGILLNSYKENNIIYSLILLPDGNLYNGIKIGDKYSLSKSNKTFKNLSVYYDAVKIEQIIKNHNINTLD